MLTSDERSDRRRAAHLAIAEVLAEDIPSRDIPQRLVERLLTHLGWIAGALWQVDENAGLLRCAAFARRDGTEPTDLERDTKARALTPGEDLPGRAWESGEPVWVPDVTADVRFLRRAPAARDGFRAAFALPIVSTEGVVGVVELFSLDVLDPDVEMLELAGAIGTHAGRLLARIESEEALRESEAINRAILGASPDAIVTTDEAGTVIEWNAAAERLFGYEREEAIGSPVADLIVPASSRDDHGDGLRAYEKSERARAPGRAVEMNAARKDGSEFFAEIVVSRIDLAGRVALTAYIRDITDRIVARRRREAQQAVTRVLADGATLHEATPRIIEALCERLGFEFGELWTRDDDEMRCVELWQDPRAPAPALAEATRGRVQRRGEGLAGAVWDECAPVWLQHDPKDPRFPRAAAAARDGLTSVFGFPITSRGEVIGAIGLHSRAAREPDADLGRLAMAIGSQIGQYMERKAAEEAIGFQKALLESQNEATLDGTVVVSRAGRIASYNQRFLELWGLADEDMAAAGEKALATVLSQLVDPEGFRAQLVSISRDRHVVDRSEVALLDGRIYERYTAPLRGEQGTHFGRAWYYRDMTDRKRVERQLAESSERFAFLAEVGTLLTVPLDYEETLAALARSAVPYLADWCVVDMVREDGDVERIAVTHSDEGTLAAAERFVHRSQADLDPSASRGVPHVLRTGKPELFPEIPQEWIVEAAGGDEELLRFISGLGLCSYMCVPLLARGRTLGAISFVTADSGRRYGQADLALAMDLARRAAIAVDNARVYAERSYVARTLQESLLPPALPRIPGIDVAARFQPAGEGADVGGDFYDLFETGRDDWAIVVGDVCGKGADAAALTALARYTIRAAAIQARKPTRVLGMLNEAILRQTTADRFCTVAYARVRQSGSGAHRLTVASGGHPLPILVRENGRVEAFGRPGTLLGIVPEPRMKDRLTELAPGDMLVIYTDGVTEARAPDGDFFGDTRLRDLLAGCAGLGADATAERIRSAALDFQHGVARDDIAVVVLKADSRQTR